MPHPTLMTPADTAVLVIDVQEKLIPFIQNADQVVRNIAFLLDGAKLLDVPVQVTEQYPKGLGKTIPELASRLPPASEKVAFSCCAIPAVVRGFEQDGRIKVLLSGIETHVCVMQTALDLLALDFRVYAAVDAVGSRFSIDHDLALRRLERAGCVLTTVETAVFEWTSGAHHPQFKAVSKLVQERMKRTAPGL